MFKISKEEPDKKNKVISMLDFLNRFSSDIKKTNVVNNIKKLELDIELKNKEIESYNKKMEHDRKSAQLEYQESASKSSFLLMLIIFGMCIGSIILTPMGFGLLEVIIEGYNSGVLEGKCENKEVVDFVLTTLLTVIIMVNGLMGFYFASISSQVNQFYYKLNGIFFFITITAIPISIAGNCNMLYKVMKFTNIVYIDLPVVILICILWDLSVIAGLRLRHYKKYRNFQFREDIEEQGSDRLTIINMLKTFTIDFIKIRLMGRFYDMRKTIDNEYKRHNPKKEDPVVNNGLNQADNNNTTVVRFPNNTTSHNKDTEYSEKERDTYLKYIIKNRKGAGIPSNSEVDKACKNKKTINLNNDKITAIREELYKCSILVKPPKRNAKSKFTNEFLEILENDFNEKELPKIIETLTEKYRNLDKENENKVDEKV